MHGTKFMASTKNSLNPYKFETLDQLKFVHDAYFSTHTNTAASYAQKLEIIHLLCFMTQLLNQKSPKEYPNAIIVLEKIFNVGLANNTDNSPGIVESLRAFGILCDDLLWGTSDKIPKPEGYSNLQEIKNKILNYFNDEWLPF